MILFSINPTFTTIGNDLLARFVSHVLRRTFHIQYFMFRVPHFLLCVLFKTSRFMFYIPLILHPHSTFEIPHSTTYIPHSTSYISHLILHIVPHIPCPIFHPRNILSPISCIPHLIFRIPVSYTRHLISYIPHVTYIRYPTSFTSHIPVQ